MEESNDGWDSDDQSGGGGDGKKVLLGRRELIAAGVADTLKAWMLSPEHFIHPYPSRQDQVLLMQQTGINKTQLMNWFKNARRRIWRPMLLEKKRIAATGGMSVSDIARRGAPAPTAHTIQTHCQKAVQAPTSKTAALASTMAPPRQSTPAATKGVVSPPRGGTKRNRSEHGEEPTRRVLQWRDRSPAKEEPETSMTDTMRSVLDDLLSDDKEQSLVQALFELSELLFDKDVAKTKKNQDAFYCVGGHADVVRLMNKHADCVRIQENGMDVLNDAMNDHPELEVAVAKVKGIDTILAAMKNFPLKQDLQQGAFQALCNLTHSASGAQRLVIDLDAAPFLVSQLKHFLNAESGDMVNADVAEWACRVILNLEDFPDLHGPLREADGLFVLATAFQTYKNDEKIRKLAEEGVKQLSQQ